MFAKLDLNSYLAVSQTIKRLKFEEMSHTQTAETMITYQPKRPHQLRPSQVKRDEQVYLEAFNEFDKDRDGFLSMEEMREFMIAVGCEEPTDEAVEYIIKLMKP